MCQRVSNAEYGDNVTDQLVEHDVLVQRQDGSQSGRPQERQTLPQHEHQDEGTVEVKRHTTASGYYQTPVSGDKIFNEATL